MLFREFPSVAEKDFWAHLKWCFEAENIPGRLRRTEERGRRGFVDLIGGFSDLSAEGLGVTYFLELKWCEQDFSRALGRRAPYGLEGPQAVELDAWAGVWVPAFLLVCFGDVSRTGMGARSTVAVWWGGHCLEFFREEGRENPPDPVVTYCGQFHWGTFLADTQEIVRGLREKES